MSSNGVNYFNLTSVYISCVVAPGAGTVAGAVNLPTGCTVQAVGTTTTGGMVTTSLIFTPATVQKLFTFPSTFVKLTSVNFLLTATAATSGLIVVDFDDAVYAVSKACV